MTAWGEAVTPTLGMTARGEAVITVIADAFDGQP